MADEDSCSSDSDSESPLTIAANAGANLSEPAKASIARERKVQSNPAEKKRNIRGTVDPNVSSWDRIKEFKGRVSYCNVW